MANPRKSDLSNQVPNQTGNRFSSDISRECPKYLEEQPNEPGVDVFRTFLNNKLPRKHSSPDLLRSIRNKIEDIR